MRVDGGAERNVTVPDRARDDATEDEGDATEEEDADRRSFPSRSFRRPAQLLRSG